MEGLVTTHQRGGWNLKEVSHLSPEGQAKGEGLCLRARAKPRKAASQTPDRSLITKHQA